MYDVRPYQTTHNTGGHIMSRDPREGVVNRYCQAWDKHNVFVMGAGNFVQNTQYNPPEWWGRWPTGRSTRSARNTCAIRAHWV